MAGAGRGAGRNLLRSQEQLEPLNFSWTRCCKVPPVRARWAPAFASYPHSSCTSPAGNVQEHSQIFPGGLHSLRSHLKGQNVSCSQILGIEGYLLVKGVCQLVKPGVCSPAPSWFSHPIPSHPGLGKGRWRNGRELWISPINHWLILK